MQRPALPRPLNASSMSSLAERTIERSRRPAQTQTTIVQSYRRIIRSNAVVDPRRLRQRCSCSHFARSCMRDITNASIVRVGQSTRR
ncbi:unnamed protein product [Sphagnum jensenii]|uniref:Uncharacterized protein n=1 Tax=Sphagnum jensenii TaxID=128206 RepID=A0ABP1A7S0_9BRYO